MSDLPRYLYGIICAAVVCAGVVAIVPKNKTTGKLISMICGILLLLHILNPILDIDLSNLSEYADDLKAESAAIVQQGVDSSSETLRQVIKEECEAYVMEKASQMGANICIDICLDEGVMPVPIEATITGNVSPYAKERLINLLTKDLNIPKERQKWI